MKRAYINRITGKYRTLDPWNIANGLTWYYEARQHAENLSKKYGLSLETIAGIIAVLSPGVRWDRNLEDAEAILQSDDAIVTTYSGNKRKALDLKHGANISKCVRGNKVRSFFDNIVSPETSEAVTLDRHMLRFILKTNNDRELNRVFSSRNTYFSIAEYIRRIARRRGLKPLQLQAMLWLQVKP